MLDQIIGVLLDGIGVDHALVVAVEHLRRDLGLHILRCNAALEHINIFSAFNRFRNDSLLAVFCVQVNILSLIFRTGVRDIEQHIRVAIAVK